MDAWGLAFLTFSCVAGGPFGIEVAVEASGAFLTIMGLLLAAILWGMPQALITAELSSSIPRNGGPVVWVERALGPRWGFLNCWIIVFQQVTDIVLYPTLIANYASQLLPSMGAIELYLLKVSVLMLSAILNILGVEGISTSASVLTACIMAPFMLLPCVAFSNGSRFDWQSVGPSGIPPSMLSNLAVFVSTVLWNMQGWSEVGCIAGEVDGKVFPVGMAIAAALVTAAYSIPVIFGVALSSDTSQWGDGYFVTLASSLSPWLGILVMLSALLANLSTLLTSMAAYTRTLQASARMGAIPILTFQKNYTKWKTPVPAILFYTLTTCIISYGLDFSSLVVFDSAFYLVGQLSVVVAFLTLKYTEPLLHRPYSFPGGIGGAILATTSSILLALVALFLTFWGEFMSGVIVVCVCVAIYASTFAVDFLPCGLRESILNFYNGMKESGAVENSNDDQENEETKEASDSYDTPLSSEEPAVFKLKDLRIS